MYFVGYEALGIAFLLLAIAATLLMYYLWGFKFNKETLRSEAPPRLQLLHRILGYLFLAIYLYLMWNMVPRLWNYQIELPARTVAHFILGLSIGAILFVKIVIVRFFKHLESTLAPILGTLLLICSVLLIGLAVPFALRETYLRSTALSGDVLDSERLELVRSHLPQLGMEDEDQVIALTSMEGLMSGRRVLVNKCTQCHDLRTVLAKPRTPENWRKTVARMAERSSVLNRIQPEEEWHVTTYLLAISPALQSSLKMKRSEDILAEEARTAAEEAEAAVAQEHKEFAYDPARGKVLVQERCTLCHSISNVENNPPNSEAEAAELVARMVRNGLWGSEEELEHIIRYITEQYVPK